MTSQIDLDFDGVFRFTNPTDEDFSFMWNNKEYLFPANSTCPMVIRNESLDNIQEIRKKAAYKLAVREFYKGKEYVKMSKMGNGLPPTFDEKVLEPVINKCLENLPESRAKMTEVRSAVTDDDFIYSAALSGGDDPREATKKAPIKNVGIMPDRII